MDGVPAPALRAHHTILSTVVPPGAKEVTFEFSSKEYTRGRLLSLLAVAVAIGLMVVPGFRSRSKPDA